MTNYKMIKNIVLQRYKHFNEQLTTRASAKNDTPKSLILLCPKFKSRRVVLIVSALDNKLHPSSCILKSTNTFFLRRRIQNVS